MSPKSPTPFFDAEILCAAVDLLDFVQLCFWAKRAKGTQFGRDFVLRAF